MRHWSDGEREKNASDTESSDMSKGEEYGKRIRKVWNKDIHRMLHMRRKTTGCKEMWISLKASGRPDRTIAAAGDSKNKGIGPEAGSTS